MILESVDHGPLIWPAIEENEATRTKKYAELPAVEKIQANCDLTATNIILQGLPSDIYSLVNHHRFANDLWKRIQLLMQGTSLTKQERERKLLPPEWSKFVTDVKLVKDLHTTNLDQLQAYLQQHELHEMKSVLCSPQYGSIHPTQHHLTTYPSTPLAISYPTTPYPNAYSSTVHQDACPQPQSIPQIEYTVSTVNQQTHLAEFPQIDSSLAVLVFKQGDDPIDAINKMMSFMSTVITSRFPTTNNQLRNSFNPRQQATIHDGRTRREHRVKPSPYPPEWNSYLLRERIKPVKLDYPGVTKGPVTQTVITHNAAHQADDLDVYDSDCDNFSTAKAVLMASLSSYGSYVLFEVVQIVLWYLESGCSKHMTRDRSQLTNFFHKFLSNVKFGNDQIVKIMRKKYILVIMDDYSRFTWVTFLASKDEAPDFIINYYESVGISHETSVAQSPHQNGVVERRNRTLVEAARTMLINAKSPLFLWAKAVSTARPGLQCMTSATSCSELIPNLIPQQPCISPPRDDWDRLFQPMFDEYFNPSTISIPLIPVADAPRAVDLADSRVSTSIDQDAPSISIPLTQDQEHSPNISQGFEKSPKTPHFHDDPLYESLHEDSTSQGSSSNVRPIHTLFESLGRWTKDHPIANVIGDPSRSVSTRNQLQTDAMWCYFDAFLTSVEPMNFKQAMNKP
uniref:Retrovirus-related Pol polyprotein from transposon TNT 1-94-like beta-barrel domain-containing protein n=1 Tax=Tanacetum cinerariifolium TaxID=118510 RepID=A0A6L2NVG8_TANCI|nr:hypothetical protein [Tanacetum cinerariifolium]